MISMGGINNGAVTGPPGIVNDNLVGSTGEPGEGSTGDWILADGTWDDNGVWDDSATWDDGV